MRPEKAYKQVHDALEYWYDTKDSSKVNRCEEAIKKCLWVDKKWHIKYNEENPDYSYEYDMRDPYDVSGYDNWKGEMDYISDRFNATHRLRWLLCGIVNNEFK